MRAAWPFEIVWERNGLAATSFQSICRDDFKSVKQVSGGRMVRITNGTNGHSHPSEIFAGG